MVVSFGATFTLICFVSGSYGSTFDVLWSSSNCNLNGGTGSGGAVHGTVTDAICCDYLEDKCKFIDQVTLCNQDDTCKWETSRHNWQGAKCVLNRDRKNNVCCQQANIKQNCVDMMKGKCPSRWQVNRECCPAPYNKYADILSADQPHLVCCNAPCEAIEKAYNGQEANYTQGTPAVAPITHCSATMSDNCGPQARSYMGQMMGSQGGLGGMGLDPAMLSQLMGMPVSKPMDIGQVIPGMGGSTGMNGGLTLAALNGMGFGSSKDSHVEEITVDDFFDAIIDGLDNDKDVFEYNKEINSDSWFGKQSFGGLVDGFSFINPMKFINRIYGSPFGLSNAQAMYGMQYGIPKSKFKHTGQHQRMTGFQNPYGPSPSQYAHQAPQYGAPAHYQHAPPTPPMYAPPVYNPAPPTPVAEPSAEPHPEPHPEPQPQYAQPYPEPQPHYAQPYPEPQPQYAQPYPEPQPHYAQPYPEPQPHYAQPYPEPQPHYTRPYPAQPYPEPQPAYQPHYVQPHPEPAYQPQYAQPYPEPHPEPQPHYAQSHPEPQYQPHPEPYYAQPHPEPHPEPQPHYAQPYPEPQPHYAQPYPEPQPHYAQPYPEPQPHYAQPYPEPQPEPYYSQPPQQYYQQPAYPPAPAHGYYGPPPMPSYGAAPAQPAPAGHVQSDPLPAVEPAVVDPTVATS